MTINLNARSLCWANFVESGQHGARIQIVFVDFYGADATIFLMNTIKRTGVKSFDHELESETFDCFSEKERAALDKEFRRKIQTKYSLYSWLLFAGAVAIAAIVTVICLVFSSPWKYLVFIAFGAYIPIGIFLYNILSTTKTKYRYFLFINQKMRDEGYNNFYFRSYMPTLCYRLIIKDQLKKYGFGDHYAELIQNFSTNEKINEYVTKEAITELLGAEATDVSIEQIAE